MSLNIDLTVFTADAVVDLTTTHLGAAHPFAAADDVIVAYAERFGIEAEDVAINNVGESDRPGEGNHVAVIIAHVLANQGHPTLDGVSADAARRAMHVLAEAEADATDALRAYDLLHALATFGRIY